MRTKFYLVSIALFFSSSLRAQDSANIHFKNIALLLPMSQGEYKKIYQDSLYFETIVALGNRKYIYVRQTVKDTLAIQTGQLGLYKITGKFYLLREGMWILEGEREKIFFQNLGKQGWVEEVRIDLEPFEYGNFGPSKIKPKKIRKSH